MTARGRAPEPAGGCGEAVEGGSEGEAGWGEGAAAGEGGCKEEGGPGSGRRPQEADQQNSQNSCLTTKPSCGALVPYGGRETTPKGRGLARMRAVLLMFVCLRRREAALLGIECRFTLAAAEAVEAVGEGEATSEEKVVEEEAGAEEEGAAGSRACSPTENNMQKHRAPVASVKERWASLGEASHWRKRGIQERKGMEQPSLLTCCGGAAPSSPCGETGALGAGEAPGPSAAMAMLRRDAPRPLSRQ